MRTSLIRATNTIGELLLLYLGLIIFAATAYAWAEAKPLGDALWWAVVTATTTGYGDQYPLTVAGRLVAAVLMHGALLFILPLMIARVIGALIDDQDRFTDAEQREILAGIAALRTSVQPWVICNAQGDRFRGWDSLGPVWVERAQDALHFADRASAEQLSAEDEDAWRIRQVSL
ncbi:MAG: potassium channel family protein [Brevundimonas sp.]